MKCHCGLEPKLPLIDLGSAPPSNAYLTEQILHAGKPARPISAMRWRPAYCWNWIGAARRRAEVSYVHTPEGREVDFFARYPTGRQELIQVSASLDDRIRASGKYGP